MGLLDREGREIESQAAWAGFVGKVVNSGGGALVTRVQRR